MTILKNTKIDLKRYRTAAACGRGSCSRFPLVPVHMKTKYKPIIPTMVCTVDCRNIFKCQSLLKAHGNEADFLRFLQKLVPHRSLTLPFEPFRFWLRICGDIRYQKTTLRLGF
jgi:hypothetical protein